MAANRRVGLTKPAANRQVGLTKPATKTEEAKNAKKAANVRTVNGPTRSSIEECPPLNEGGVTATFVGGLYLTHALSPLAVANSGV